MLTCKKKTSRVFFSITCGPILDPFYPSEPSLGPTAKPPSRLYAAINIAVYSSILHLHDVFISNLRVVLHANKLWPKHVQWNAEAYHKTGVPPLPLECCISGLGRVGGGGGKGGKKTFIPSIKRKSGFFLKFFKVF